MLPTITFTTTPTDHPTDLLAAAQAAQADAGGPGDAAGAAGAAGAEPLAWLRRGDGFVGLGEAARFETSGPRRFGAAEDWWRAVLARATINGPADHPGMGPLALGAFAFSPASAEPSVLVVPRTLIARHRGREWITTADAAGCEAAPAPVPTDQGRGRPRPRPAGDAAPPQAMTESPGPVAAADWPAVVRRGIGLIEAGGLDKVVLARSVVAHAAAGRIDPQAVLAFLAGHYRDTWTFAVDGLIGATPELLIRSSRGLVTSRVLAGTIRRRGSDQANLARAAALARSSKDLEEHEFAVASVVAALAPLVEELAVPDIPSVLHLPNVMHLATDVVGELKRTPGGRLPGALSLVAALHPSAAVCGTPAAEAARVIGQLEGRDRGRYSGPVGWIDANGAGEWGIALRCAQLSPDRREARLWAGGGIVAASDPAAELAETEAKLAPMRQALGLGEPPGPA
ncbi:MAG: isochorismate synthase [Bifidobacteriaceae bacterium]|jgi:menaquinone-specific isochorismate synthase|nr:isochorismate synthase [Bifidobacteriaceae bacterium]